MTPGWALELRCLMLDERHSAFDRSSERRGGKTATHGADHKATGRQTIARAWRRRMGNAGHRSQSRTCHNSSTGLHDHVTGAKSNLKLRRVLYRLALVVPVAPGGENADPVSQASCRGRFQRVQIRPKFGAGNASGRFNRQNKFSRYAPFGAHEPVPDLRLRCADPVSQVLLATGGFAGAA